MKLFEFIDIHKELLQRLFSLGYKTNDIIYLKMYNDYIDMAKSNLKKTYIVASLCDKYKISEKTVYNAINHLEKDM